MCVFVCLADLSKENSFKIFEEQGIFSPIDLNPWERMAFAEMTR